MSKAKSRSWKIDCERVVCREWEQREDQIFRILRAAPSSGEFGHPLPTQVSEEPAEELKKASGG